MATRQQVFSAVSDERVFQDRKWGTVADHPHEVGSWLTIMRQLINDAERAYMSRRGDFGAIDELRKVVAVGVACMEQHGIVPRAPIDFVEQSQNFTVHKADTAPQERTVMNWRKIEMAPLGVPVIIADSIGRVGEGKFRRVTEPGCRPGQLVGDIVANFIRPDSWGEHQCKAVAFMSMPLPPDSND